MRMDEDKMIPFECKRFLSLIDRYIDGELTNDEKAFFDAHASTCRKCENELRIADMMKTAMSEVDDDITVPPSAQSAWRSAVRKEISRKKSRRLIRTLTSVAAAFVVLVGTTFAMRGAGALPSEYKAEDNPAHVTGGFTQKAASNEGIMTARSMPAGGIYIEADGSVDTLTTSGDAAIYEEEIIRSAQRVAQTNDYDNDMRLLYELTEEYDGQVTEEYQNLSLDTRSVTVISKIPVELMDEYLLALDNIGRTTALDKISEDASLVYYELDARLESARLTADRLNALIAEADGETIGELTAQLENAYLEIDALESQRMMKDNDIAYARITVTLNELPGATVIEKSTLSERSSEGFRQSASAIGRFFEDMVVSVAVIAPVLLAILAVGIVAIAIRFAVKKTGKKKTEEK